MYKKKYIKYKTKFINLKYGGASMSESIQLIDYMKLHFDPRVKKNPERYNEFYYRYNYLNLYRINVIIDYDENTAISNLTNNIDAFLVKINTSKYNRKLLLRNVEDVRNFLKNEIDLFNIINHKLTSIFQLNSDIFYISPDITKYGNWVKKFDKNDDNKVFYFTAICSGLSDLTSLTEIHVELLENLLKHMKEQFGIDYKTNIMIFYPDKFPFLRIHFHNQYLTEGIHNRKTIFSLQQVIYDLKMGINLKKLMSIIHPKYDYRQYGGVTESKEEEIDNGITKSINHELITLNENGIYNIKIKPDIKLENITVTNQKNLIMNSVCTEIYNVKIDKENFTEFKQNSISKYIQKNHFKEYFNLNKDMYSSKFHFCKILNEYKKLLFVKEKPDFPRLYTGFEYNDLDKKEKYLFKNTFKILKNSDFVFRLNIPYYSNNRKKIGNSNELVAILYWFPSSIRDEIIELNKEMFDNLDNSENIEKINFEKLKIINNKLIKSKYDENFLFNLRHLNTTHIDMLNKMKEETLEHVKNCINEIIDDYTKRIDSGESELNEELENYKSLGETIKKHGDILLSAHTLNTPGVSVLHFHVRIGMYDVSYLNRDRNWSLNKIISYLEYCRDYDYNLNYFQNASLYCIVDDDTKEFLDSIQKTDENENDACESFSIVNNKKIQNY